MEMMVLFLLFSVVLSPILSDRHDMSLIQEHSWISNENFTTLIQLSFPISKCCNIYFNESMQDDEAIFNQFRRIYPYTYTLRSRNHECEGYFLLGRSAEIARDMNEVQSLILTTEILIILNDNIESNSSMFNASLYGNANVNIVSISGMWTLTENYLAPRVFQKHRRFDEMVHDYDHINLQGRELQVSSVYRRPFSYVWERITKNINGVEVEVYPVIHDREKRGVEQKLYLIIAEKLNFTATIRKPEGSQRYGTRDGEKWNGGMIQMLIERKIDLAFGRIPLSQDINTFVSLSMPWHQVFMHFLVPRPKSTTSFWVLKKPLSGTVWCFLISTVFVSSLYTYARAWSDERLPRRFRNFVIALIDLIGYFLSKLSPKKLRILKFEMFLWQIAGWLIVVAYSSNLAAVLTSSEYEDRIDTVQQFLDANLSWGTFNTKSELKTMLDFTGPYSESLFNQYHEFYDPWAPHRLHRTGSYSVLGMATHLQFLPDLDDDSPILDTEHYRLMREPVSKYYITFAVQHWLLEPVNRVILGLEQTGITQLHLRDAIRYEEHVDHREFFTEYDVNDGTPRVLGLKPLAAAFSMLLLGLFISTFVFCLELKRARRSTSIREVPRNVSRKRNLRAITIDGSNRRVRNIKLKNCKRDLSSIQFEMHPSHSTF